VRFESNFQPINQSIINPYVAWLLQGWNCYIAQFDSLEQRSDDEIWIRLAEEPWLQVPTEWRQRLSGRRLRWQGVPDAWSSNRESPATDGREPDGPWRKYANVACQWNGGACNIYWGEIGIRMCTLRMASDLSGFRAIPFWLNHAWRETRHNCKAEIWSLSSPC